MKDAGSGSFSLDSGYLNISFSHVNILVLEVTDVCSGGKVVLEGPQRGQAWAGVGGNEGTEQ